MITRKNYFTSNKICEQRNFVSDEEQRQLISVGIGVYTCWLKLWLTKVASRARLRGLLVLLPSSYIHNNTSC